MNFNIIQAAEVKLWDFSAYFWNTPRTVEFFKAYEAVPWRLCDRTINYCQVLFHLSLVVRKPVFGVFDQVQHKLGCTATEDD